MLFLKQRRTRFYFYRVHAFVFLLFNLCSSIIYNDVYSQGYPIIVTTQVIPPYTIYLRDYAVEARLNIIIQPLDQSLSNYRAKLMMEIKGDRLILKTSPGVAKEVIINGGEPQILNGYDVSTLLAPEHLSINGSGKSDFYSTGRLPEGFYTFNFYLVDYYRDITVAQTVPAMAFLVLNDPPIINEPRQGQRLRMTDPQNILFQWTPRHMGSPNSAFTCQYEFSLYEVLDKTLPAGEVVRTSVPFFTTTIENSANSFLYGADQSLLIPGQDYVFRIKVFDTEGQDLFRNDGYSEAIKFTYGQECLPPKSIYTKAIAGNGITAYWDQSLAHTAYDIKYQKEGGENWYTAEPEGAGTRIYGLTEGTKYYIQIKSHCGSFESDWSEPFSLVAPKPKEKNVFQCSSDNQLSPVANVNPLSQLKIGDIISAGGYKALITKVTNSRLPFSGECLVTVPYYGYASVPHVFTNIKLNTNYEMYEGELVSKSSTNSPFLVNIENYNYKFDSTSITNSQFTDGEINMLEIPPKFISGTIEKVEKGPQENTIIVTTTNGNTLVLDSGNPMLLADDSGNQYTVDSQGNVKQVPKNQQVGNYAATKGNVEQQNTSVMFKLYDGQQYGFDNYRFEVLQTDYNFKEIEDKNVYISWKSLEAGKSDNVALEVNMPEGKEIKIADENGIPYTISEDSKTHLKTINVTAPSSKSDKTVLTAYYTQTDADGKERKITSGELNLVTYIEKTVKVVLIPVNDAVIPAEYIENYLNKVYSQAAVSFTVTTGEKLEVTDWDLNGNNNFDEGQDQVFSNYTDEMNNIIEKYKASNSCDEETYYMFVLPFKPAKNGKTGQMPITKQWGFIFLDNAKGEFSHTIAHELGHGAFRLEHPFSQWGIPQGSTQNLMDYTASGTELYKYQWDWVQDPGWKVYGLLSGEESASKKLEITGCSAFLNAEIFTDQNKFHVKRASNNQLQVLFNDKSDTSKKSIDVSVVIEKEDDTTKIHFPEKGTIKINAGKLTDIGLKSIPEGRYTMTFQSGKLSTVRTFFVREKAYDFACTICGRDLSITLTRLKAIFPNSSILNERDADQIAEFFNTALAKFNTCDRQAKLFAQIAHESGGFNATEEGILKNGQALDWSLKSLLSSFKRTSGAKIHWFNQDFWDKKQYKQFITVDYYETIDKNETGTHVAQDTTDYFGEYNGQKQTQYKVRIPENFKQDAKGSCKIYNIKESDKAQIRKNIFTYAYGGVNGNHDPSSDPSTQDGWLYRGRGAIQLTGRNNYSAIQDKMTSLLNKNFNLFNNPDTVASDNEVIVYSAIAFVLLNLSTIEDLDKLTIDQLSAIVNTGNIKSSIRNVNGADDRRNRYNSYKTDISLFKCTDK
jgi:predicted chitinase